MQHAQSQHASPRELEPSSPESFSAESFSPESFRARFPIVARTNYLVSHSLGAMPATVYDKLRAFADQWATRGVRAWGEGWWSAPVDVGNVLAKVLNAPSGSIVMHPNVSTIEALVASSLDFGGRRNKVVYTDQNFPTVMYVWQGFEKLGARIHVVKSEDGITVPTERLLEAIDEQTLIVPISHVLYKSSYLQDAAAICARAREVGALVLLDTYQSLGTVPVDVQALGVDMVCGGSVKWLCGGPGAGYLYVRPDLLPRFEPRITGWAASAAPFAFEPRQRYAADTRRMLNGSPAVAALYAATAGYEMLLEAGVERVRAYSQSLTERLREKLQERGFRIASPTDPRQRGGSLTVVLRDDEDGKAIVAALAARDILVDYRPGAGVRVSPHYYNRRDELDAFASALSELRETRAWREHAAGAKSY